jgi:ribosomal protein S12 methylthiotransferase accessory factor
LKRSELRAQSAAYLNTLSRDELFERFEITRIGNITGLDVIGVPVYSSCRPASKVISVSAGKSRDKRLSRAGAIAEGIEFHTFENTRGEFEIAPFKSVDPSLLPIASCSKWNIDDPIPQEKVTRAVTRQTEYLPSELVWLIGRAELKKAASFQMSSNGQALGFGFLDAFLTGIYECVERDQSVLRMCSWQTLGIMPPRVSFDCAPDSIQELKNAIERAGLKVYLSYCTWDIPLPVFWAILVDPHGGVGSLAGWGCDLSPEKAAERAILEAIQTRAVYIAGARDDILRRDFSLTREADQKAIMAELESIEPTVSITSIAEPDIEIECDIALRALGPHVNNLYFKHINLGDLHAVKTIILGLEQPRTKVWTSTRWEKLRVQWNEVEPLCTPGMMFR